VPGLTPASQDDARLRRPFGVGLPVLLKASAGGAQGMRTIRTPDEDRRGDSRGAQRSRARVRDGTVYVSA